MHVLTDGGWQEDHFLRAEAESDRASFSLDKVNEASIPRYMKMRSENRLAVGDMVHLDARNLPSPTPMVCKRRFVGPFPIIKRVGSSPFGT